MTGTASELYEYNDYDKLINTQLFSSWLLGKINANCLLSDISLNGCSILIPKKHLPLKEFFSLIIMSPENSEKVHITLPTRQCWKDDNYSSTYTKVGIEFIEINKSFIEEINSLITYFDSPIKPCAPMIRCSIVNK